MELWRCLTTLVDHWDRSGQHRLGARSSPKSMIWVAICERHDKNEEKNCTMRAILWSSIPKAIPLTLPFSLYWLPFTLILASPLDKNSRTGHFESKRVVGLLLVWETDITRIFSCGYNMYLFLWMLRHHENAVYIAPQPWRAKSKEMVQIWNK